MNVLFLTDEFYPEFGANSLIVKTVAGEMVKRDVKVYVMPAVYNKSLPTEEEYQGIRIIRGIPADDRENAVAAFNRGRILTALNVIIRHFLIKREKRERLWHKDRILERDYLRKFIIDNSIDAVISVNCSIELSFPIYWLKKQGKVTCKWFFYMLDPFESHMYYREHYVISKLRKTQHQIMAVADGTFATSIICNEVNAWEDESITAKLHDLEFPKIEEPTIIPCEDDIELPDGQVNVVCTGSRNEKVRKSDFALKVCKSITDENVVFHFVGIGWTDVDARKDGNCVFYTPRSWQAIRNMQQRASFLLNIGNSISNQLPSKILEYISTGLPIINFYKNDDCPSLRLLAGYEALNVHESSHEIAVRETEDFLKKHHKPISFNRISRDYLCFTPENVTDIIMQMI